ncbi:hypothetical protein HDV05_003035 [Chytridiales sp. JEL 0842]|nr:hypothetical protein HDV05_003035 [Chytridiales sp. JEL 0842]
MDIRNYFKKPPQSKPAGDTASKKERKPASGSSGSPIVLDSDDDFQEKAPVTSKFFNGDSSASSSSSSKPSAKRETTDSKSGASKKVKVEEPAPAQSITPESFFGGSKKIHQTMKVTPKTSPSKKSAAGSSAGGSKVKVDKDSYDDHAFDTFFDDQMDVEPSAVDKDIEPVVVKPEPKVKKEVPASPVNKKVTPISTPTPSVVSSSPAKKGRVLPWNSDNAASEKTAKVSKYDQIEDREEDEEKSQKKPVSEKQGRFMKIMEKKQQRAAVHSSADLPVGAEDCLKDLTFVFTGDMPTLSRDDGQDLVKRHGGRVTSAVSGKTSYLVVGDEPGESKINKAKQVKVKMINQDEFLELVRTLPGKGGDAAAVSSQQQKNVVPAKRKSKAVLEDSTNEMAVPEKMAKTSMMASATTPESKQRGLEPVNAPKKPGPVRELWTTKYKPTSLHDLIGNKKNAERLSTWLRRWNPNGTPPKTISKDEPGDARAILISGPPGIGKTTAAHLVARLEGYEAIEFNASDTRSKKSVKECIRDITDTHTMTEYFSADPKNKKAKKKQVLIMDEVDGMSAGDRGGISELITIIKKTKIPIICICNDRQSPKVKSLVNSCYDMRFQRPRTNEIEKTLTAIATREGLQLKSNVVDNLVKSTGADIRQIFNILSTYALQASELNFDTSKEIAKSSEKNMTIGPWDATSKLFGKYTFREASMNDKMDLYFNDHSLMPLMVQENYIRMDPQLAHDTAGGHKVGLAIETLLLLANAAESIASADIIDNVLHKSNNWTLMPLHAVMSTVRPAFFMHGTFVSNGPSYGPGGGYAFPGWLGKNSTQGKNVRLLKEIQLHMRLHTSANKDEVRQSYMPALAPRLTAPLVTKQADGIQDVIDLMDEYYLTKDDWDAILDIGLESCSGKALTANIPTNVKSTFTRTYNKGNHPVPYITSSALGKPAKSSRRDVPDFEDAVEVDDEDVEEEEGDEGSDVDGDRLIQKKEKKAAGGKSAGGAAAAKGKGKGKAKK